MLLFLLGVSFLNVNCINTYDYQIFKNLRAIAYLQKRRANHKSYAFV